MSVLEILILIVAAAVIFYLVTQVIAPRIGNPWGNILVVAVALIFVIYLLTRFFPSIMGARI